MRFKALLAAVFLATIVSVPSSIAACYSIISAQQGDPISLALSPTSEMDLLWTTPQVFPNQAPTGTSITGSSTLTFEAPPVTVGMTLAQATAWRDAYILAHPTLTPPPAAASLEGCQIFTITGQITAHPTGKSAYSSCIDSCEVYLIVCPRSCPTTEERDLCISDWTNYMQNNPPLTPAEETAADWQLNVGGTWATGTTFTWTVKEGSTTVGSSHVSTDVTSHTFVLGDFNAPTLSDLERCFTVGVVVTSAGGQTLLTCPNVGSLCLVYDPSGDISISV